MSFSLRPLTSHDYPSVDALLTAAYTPSTSMMDDLAHYHRLQPDGWIIALRNEVPIGIGGALLYGTFARIGLMAVLPEIQRQGIGAAILHHLLTWIANRGVTTVFLTATPAGVPLYEKFGFVSSGSTYACIQRDSNALVGTGTIVTKRLEPDELSEMVLYDAGIFGTQRTEVLTSYYEAFPDRTFITRDSYGSITGYIIAQTRRLGPWFAETPEIAESLLQQALHLSFSQPPMILIPESNQGARHLLTQAGFLPERRWQAMHLGVVRNLPRHQRLYAYANLYVG